MKKLNKTLFVSIHDAYENGARSTELARDYGLTLNQIDKIIRAKSWEALNESEVFTQHNERLYDVETPSKKMVDLNDDLEDLKESAEEDEEETENEEDTVAVTSIEKAVEKLPVYVEDEKTSLKIQSYLENTIDQVGDVLSKLHRSINKIDFTEALRK